MKGVPLTNVEFDWILSRLTEYREDLKREGANLLLKENYVRDVERLIQHTAFVEEQRASSRSEAKCWKSAEEGDLAAAAKLAMTPRPDWLTEEKP